jgi:hypothetical protein
MKHIKNFKSYNERKSVGLIYHFTSEAGLKGIMETNRLNCSEEYYMHDEHYYVSFTRNKNFHSRGALFHVKADYRITLDGDKLSDRYKIQPFAYNGGWDAENWEEDGYELENNPELLADYNHRYNCTGKYDEMEERINFENEDGGIDDIRKYIIAVDKLK